MWYHILELPRALNMISLEKFTEKDFDRFIGWINCEEELIQFAGPLFRYPLSSDQLYDYLNQKKKVPYRVKLNETQQIIGHCELNYENKTPRLSRILIGDKDLRNKGVGKNILHTMINIVFTTTEFDSIDLSVFNWNLNAINCYKKIGFVIRPELETSMIVNGQCWKAHNMILTRSNYTQYIF